MSGGRLIATERGHPDASTCAVSGEIVLEPMKASWLAMMSIGGIIGVVLFADWAAFAVFLVLSAITLCAGHSVGMHRLLIHRAFRAPLWVERALVYLGTLVGMAGPFGMIRAHDMREWRQRQTHCPPHPSHDAPFFRDAYWRLCCRFHLERPPTIAIEPRLREDRFYRFWEATWMAQQLPIAVALYLIGGWGWVLWGVRLRVAVSLIGHWAVGHCAHKSGRQGWAVEGLPVQGYDLPSLALLTFGESWRGNHHGFPHSAKLGVEPGQSDLGFAFIRVLEALGLARDIRGPSSEPPREGLVRIASATENGAPQRRA